MSVPHDLSKFSEIWCCDFEFSARPGERPYPVCMVAREFKSQRVINLWADELRQRTAAPFPVDRNTLFVAYYASAEMGCFLALGWPLPVFILDLYVEFRNLTNGLTLPCGRGLVGALSWYGLDSIAADEKDEMRALALRGGPWTGDERVALLDYCQGDVDALVQLLPRMQPALNFPHALFRDRFMKAAAHMEDAGVPIDVPTWQALVANWQGIQGQLIQQQDTHGVYDGLTFKAERWADVVERHGILWPRLASGKLSLSDEAFKEAAKIHPVAKQYQKIRNTLSKLRLNDLSVGQDGRNRCLLSPFSTKTGRNAPSNSKFIFGPPVWLRALIQPKPGRAIAYIDYSQQEFAIAAVLSGDQEMISAYESGDAYLAFAKQAKAVPSDATKVSHRETRDLFKQCILATQYGMEAPALAVRIQKSEQEARELLRLHRRIYKQFWRWSDNAEAHALLTGKLQTIYGWQMRLETGKRPNLRSLRNFPVQANGAEMLRLGCCLATERGMLIAAPVHDAVLIESYSDDIDHAVATTQKCLAEASAAVLGGFTLRSDCKIVRHPDRYLDERGEAMWLRVMGLIPEQPRPKCTRYLGQNVLPVQYSLYVFLISLLEIEVCSL